MLRLLIFSLLLTACAETRIKTKTSKGATNEATFQGDMTNTTYTVSADGAIGWHADSVNHSGPTVAGGKAIAGGAASFGTAVATSGVLGAFR